MVAGDETQREEFIYVAQRVVSLLWVRHSSREKRKNKVSAFWDVTLQSKGL